MKLSYRIIDKCRNVLPAPIRKIVRSVIPLKEYDRARRIESNPYKDLLEENYGSKFVLGIIEDVFQYHKYYIAACREKQISYKVLSILDDNWIATFMNSGCDAYLVWPSNKPTSAKEAFDYRLYILEKELGSVVYPTWKECWLTEHKPRLRDWLEANGIPHPETWVFYEQSEALNFSKDVSFPVVVKTATGASASGISIIRNKRQLIKTINLAFSKGLRPKTFEPYDRQRGYIYIQKYYPKVQEWRMVRIGDSYFGYRKEPGKSGLHSASKNWSWLDPGRELLELTRMVTERGQFTSMDVDIFITQEGQMLINECQTVFGCTTPAIQMKVNDKPARYIYRDGQWILEEGNFCQNHMCNLRVEYLLSLLKKS